MKFSLLAIFMMALSSVAEAVLEEELSRVLEHEGLTGIAWSLVENDGNIRLGAAGLRDNAFGLAFKTDTRFHVGSLTKTVLATGILRMATEGLVDLDAPVTEHLGTLKIDNPWVMSSQVTIRHLLDHTAGLNDAQMWQMFSLRPTPDTPLVDAFPNPARQLKVRSRPGSQFSYSNTGYTLLGMVIESISGVRYETYLDTHVLQPLGMHQSTFVFTSQQGDVIDTQLAWGHVDDGSRYAASPIFLRPAGQFTSTAADLAIFAAFLMSDGVVNGSTFIMEELMRTRGRPVTTLAAQAGLEAGYSLGLGRRDRHGVVGFCHGGNIVGFVAMLCVFPEQRKAFAFSVNTDSETSDYAQFSRLFIDALGIERATSPEIIDVSLNMDPWFGWYVPNPNRFASFKYLDRVFGAVRVSEDSGGISWWMMQSKPRLLNQVAERMFVAEDRATTSHVFIKGENGELLASDGFQTYERVSLGFLAAHWLSAGLGILGIAWILLAGTASLAANPRAYPGKAVSPATLACYLMLLPLPLFLTQPFMALGDLTPASASLFIVTILYPVGLLLTGLRGWKTRRDSRLNILHALAAFFALQWCLVLVDAGMLPLRLWAL